MFEVLRRNGRALKYLHEELQLERELVLQAVHSNGRALQHAALLMRQDRDLVMCAVQQVAHTHARSVTLLCVAGRICFEMGSCRAAKRS